MPQFQCTIILVKPPKTLIIRFPAIITLMTQPGRRQYRYRTLAQRRRNRKTPPLHLRYRILPNLLTYKRITHQLCLLKLRLIASHDNSRITPCQNSLPELKTACGPPYSLHTPQWSPK